MGVTVGDEINPEDTWILIWKRLSVISRSYISVICYNPAKEDRLGIMTSRYEISRDLLVYSERTYLEYLYLGDLTETTRPYRKLKLQPEMKDCLGVITPRCDNTSE
jgi:hypothetical protein